MWATLFCKSNMGAENKDPMMYVGSFLYAYLTTDGWEMAKFLPKMDENHNAHY